MRKKRDERGQASQDEKILDLNANMQGTLRFDDPVNLRISGNFEGTLDTRGKLMIGNKAVIRANITGETIVIAGEVTGSIKTTKVLQLSSSAVLNGDIETPGLSIEDGAVINGRLSMAKQASFSDEQHSRGDWMNVDQISKYLEVETSKISEWAEGGMLPGTREEGEWVFDRNKVDQWIAEGKVKV